MYKYYNPNPAGNMVRDCVVRAISKAEDQSWDKSYWGICISGFVYKDMPDANKSWGKYLQSLGYKRGALPNTCPDCYTVKEFCQDYPQGTYVVCTGNHAVAVVDGNYYDAWDSGDEVPVYYWRKEVK
jgi:hypothetical protein